MGILMPRKIAPNPPVWLQWYQNAYNESTTINTTDSNFHETHMGPTWGRQDPGEPHVGLMMAPWTLLSGTTENIVCCWGCPDKTIICKSPMKPDLSCSIYHANHISVLFTQCHNKYISVPSIITCQGNINQSGCYGITALPSVFCYVTCLYGDDNRDMLW